MGVWSIWLLKHSMLNTTLAAAGTGWRSPMDPSARSTAAQIVLVNITMEMVTTSAAPSPDPSAQSPPSLSRSTLTDPSPNQASGQHGQLKEQIQLQLQHLPLVNEYTHQVYWTVIVMTICFKLPIAIAEFRTLHPEWGSSEERRPSLTSSPGLSTWAWAVEEPWSLTSMCSQLPTVLIKDGNPNR